MTGGMFMRVTATHKWLADKQFPILTYKTFSHIPSKLILPVKEPTTKIKAYAPSGLGWVRLSLLSNNSLLGHSFKDGYHN